MCILLEGIKSIVIDSAATSLSWSLISLQKCGCKIVNNYCFTPAWSEQESAEEEIAETTHPHQLSRFFSVHCSFDLLKKYSSFSFYIKVLQALLAVKRIPRSSWGFCHEEMKVTKPV